MQPATLIVSPENEQAAKTLLHSAWNFRDQSSDRQGTANPYQNIAALEIEPRLSLGCTSPITKSTPQVGSATAWYLTAAPAFLPAIVGFLGSGESPQVLVSGPDTYFANAGTGIRVIHDFGFSLGDYRACVKSAGA